jgi:hypothetical protein
VKSRIPINEVFTPRSHDVNPDMYIPRPLHEKELRRAISGSMHTIVSGSSGTGKSWLCKKVAKDERWVVKVANCANASRFNSLTEEVCNALIPVGEMENTSYSRILKAEAGVVMKGGVDTSREFEVFRMERLERAFLIARKQAGRSILVVVLDNLEAIFQDVNLMRELANLILLLDDDRYARYEVKLLIVGIPSEIREYYHVLPDLEPVANRLTEIPPLRSLSSKQVRELVRRGFQNELLVELGEKNLNQWAEHIYSVTLGLAQRVHEYCESLAYCLEDAKWVPSDDLLAQADNKFLISSLHKAYAVIESCMNERHTKTSRRNQVLYALGTIGDPEFDSRVVEGRLRELFPNSTEGVTLGVNRILVELCEQDRALLRRISKTNSFSFSDPKYLMCLRLVLIRNENESISKKLFRR